MKRCIKLGICTVLTLLMIAFIFWNSAQPTSASIQASVRVTEKVETVAEQSGIHDKVLSQRQATHYIRKAAHAIEFFALGALLFLSATVLHKTPRLQTIWNILSVSLLVAVTDEAIQIWSGRGPKVQDVLLDFCGATAAILLCSLVYYGIRAIFRTFRRRRLRLRGDK